MVVTKLQDGPRLGFLYFQLSFNCLLRKETEFS